MASRQSSDDASAGRSPVTSPTEKPSQPRRRSSIPTASSSTNLDFRRSSAADLEDEDLIEYEAEDEVDDLRRSSSMSSQSTRGKRRASYNNIPLSPPSVGSDDDYYQDDVAREIRAENVLGHWHFAPLLIAIVPPLGAVLGGGADAWSDAILLVIATFYLYQLLKVPHDMYHAARTRRILSSDTEEESVEGQQPFNVEQRRERLAAAAELRRAELISIFALVASPIMGAWLLHWLMETFTDGNRYLNKFNIRLFMLASGIKPWSHAVSLLKKRLLHLQEVVHYPSSRVESLNRRLAKLEMDITSLRKLVAMKSDVSLLRDGIDLPLTQLSRTMRRYEKKEEHLRMSAEDKFALMESRLEDLLREVAINAELIEEQRMERQRALSLPASMYQALRYALGQQKQESAHRELLYDTPRNLPSSVQLNLPAPTSPTNQASSPTSGSQSTSYTKASHAMPSSTSSDSLPGYSSPPRYPQKSPTRAPSAKNSHSPFSAVSPPSSTSKPAGWTEEGLAYWVFLPINIPKSVFRSAFSFASDRVNEAKDVTDYGYATIANPALTKRERQSRLVDGSNTSSATVNANNTRYSTTTITSDLPSSRSSKISASLSTSPYPRRA